MTITQTFEQSLQFAIDYNMPLVIYEYQWHYIGEKAYYRVEPLEDEDSCVARWRITLKPEGSAYAD